MAETIKLSILSPERRLVQGVSVEYLTISTSEGQIQILPGHAPIVGTIDTGKLGYRPTGEEETVAAVSSGFFKVTADGITVMAETLELVGEINVERARKAQQTAEQTLKDANLEPAHFRKYQLKLQRSLIRQQVAAREA